MDIESVEEREKKIIKDFAYHLDKSMKDMLLVYVASQMFARDKPQAIEFLNNWGNINITQQAEFIKDKYATMSEYDKNRSLSEARYSALFKASVDEAVDSWKAVLGLSNLIMS